jgi:glc operon protein GlcG
LPASDQLRLGSKKVLTLDAAKLIATAASEEASKNHWNMAICVVDDGGHAIYLERMDGTQVASVVVAQEKASTAARFKRSTKVLEDAVLGGRSVLLKLEGAIPIEGGLPITIEGQVIGAIGVSGGSSSQDGQVAAAGIAVIV